MYIVVQCATLKGKKQDRIVGKCRNYDRAVKISQGTKKLCFVVDEDALFPTMSIKFMTNNRDVDHLDTWPADWEKAPPHFGEMLK